MSEPRAVTTRRTGIFVTAALATAATILALPAPAGLDPRGAAVLAVTAAMAILWVSEALPLAVTALIPLLAFPLLGVLSSDATAREYVNDLIFLFFGGFFLARSLERWELHRRIALHVVAVCGTRPRRLVLGVMLAVGVLSMWISNTATALMMLPICIALTTQLEESGAAEADVRRFGTALLLGVAYAANIGGMGTPIGTGPNGIFLRQFDGPMRPSFLQWMAFGVPLALAFLGTAWWLLTSVLFRFEAGASFGARQVVRERLRALGPMSPHERCVLAVFAGAVALWVTRSDVELGGIVIPGWVSGLRALGMEHLADGARGGIGDSAVAILAVLALCTLRCGPDRQPVADWRMGESVPWGMLLLLGGGFAIARGFGVGEPGTSLSEFLGARLAALADGSPLVVLPGVALCVSVMTELTSNTATTSVVVPVLAGIGTPEAGRLLALVAALSASCAFMLPVATPPNAIVFGSGRLSIRTMALAGVALNLAGAVLVPLAVWFLARAVLP